MEMNNIQGFQFTVQTGNHGRLQRAPEMATFCTQMPIAFFPAERVYIFHHILKGISGLKRSSITTLHIGSEMQYSSGSYLSKGQKIHTNT